MKKLGTLLALIAATLMLNAQTQTVKGTVFDIQSQSPLPFASVSISNLEDPIGTITDDNGLFRLENVPVGRHTLQVRFMGYKTATIPNILVNAGKELEVDVQMEEMVNKIEEVVIEGGPEKQEAINELALISARSINMEEAIRFSGTRQDPSRMAQNFAGVSNVSDDRNDIVIRGNSPTGVLWRMEGIDIPNPNHYATLGTTGGPVSMLNTNNLKNSDFLTGAFPAEYGNATSGAFRFVFEEMVTEISMNLWVRLVLMVSNLAQKVRYQRKKRLLS